MDALRPQICGTRGSLQPPPPATADSTTRSHSFSLAVALIRTPNRFRAKRQLWAYTGFALETHNSGEYRMVRRRVERNRERLTVLGLNESHKSRPEESVQRCCHMGQRSPWPSVRFLCVCRQRSAALGPETSRARATDHCELFDFIISQARTA